MAETKFLGLAVQRWVEYLAATVLANLIHSYSLEPHLLEYLRHNNKARIWGVWWIF
ncbi:MAG: hypothetical protein WB985_19600 [Candidatus Acidiferrales bacterium]